MRQNKTKVGLKACCVFSLCLGIIGQNKTKVGLKAIYLLKDGRGISQSE